MAGGLRTRSAELGLASIALDRSSWPPTALVLTVFAVIDLIRSLVADVIAVAAIVRRYRDVNGTARGHIWSWERCADACKGGLDRHDLRRNSGSRPTGQEN
jgi:hypothetical protein